jgi:puromycin-sensitive aminopeptidase
MDPYRLPRSVIPTRYELRLQPDLAAATFTGQEVVTVEVRESVTDVWLNAIELQIDQARLQRDSISLEPAVALDPQTERCRLTFAAPLATGTYWLHLSFRGVLNNKLRGFYRSQYKDAAGHVHFLAATQFEATDARRAFPCWDEPAFKAVFASTLVIDPALTAVSNTAVAAEEVRDGKKVVRFADTIPMSTYLVAYVVGELEATEPVLVGRAPLRVWTVPGKRALTRVGQEIGVFSLRYFEDFYGRPYPGDKLDLLAIPDFAAGAMENLGAITFRETALLVDETKATHNELERVADVVAHENAHMWFGDLVTMSWWNGLWLNEAFATFMEMLAVDAWKPQWQRWTTFGVSRAAALLVDGLQSTRPVEYPVNAPADADAMFDVLTYEKGCSVLRMLEQHLGPEVFRAGVRLYLDRHAYGNTETSDLWVALGDAARLPIPEVMDGWVFRPGYPLLSVERDGPTGLLIRQQPFTYLPRDGDGQVWQVPVQLRTLTRRASEGASRRLLLTEAETRLDVPGDFESVLVNENGHGFYRVGYSAELLEALLRQLPDGLSAIERFNLVNDTWAATLAGLVPVREYLDLTARFRGERDKNVWAILAASFHAVNRIILDADRPGLEAMVRDRASAAVADLGPEARPGEDDLARQLRGDLLRLLGILGNDAATQQHALEVYDTAQRSPERVDANVLTAAIHILAHVGDIARYDAFLGRFRSAKTPQEEQRYLYALAGFRPAPLVRGTLDRTLNGEIRTQDAPFVIRSLLTSVHGRALAWEFFKANWERMNQAFPMTGVRRMCDGATGLATPEWERDVRDFFTQKRVDLGGKTLQQILEQLHIAVRLREREGAALHEYLAPRK